MANKVVLILSVVVALAVAQTRLKDLVQLGGRSYYFSKDQLTWTDAQNFCRSHGLELAALETQEEDRLVYKQWLVSIPRVQRRSWFTWIGGTDEGTEGRWRWSGSGRPLTYTNWHPREPNLHPEADPNGGTNENCIIMCDRHRGKWGYWCDFPCNNKNHYVCEGK